ncbi:hypothetical protein M434DRAFT_395060 [Hypoxylon sp. CO27-5]|nr:hypothetical protein M434DRAFT_395060 [Hypoxylon sp. CO27-5]
MPETLREKAAKRIHGPNANPSQLGDPISLKAEQSDYIPAEEEWGAAETSQSIPNNPSNDSHSKDESRRHRDNATLREKATRKLHGPEANPSQLGDPISLKAEITDNVPADWEEGAQNGRNSKL